MNQQTTQNLALFDLLARSWRRPAAVADVCFSADGSAIAFTSVDGSVAIGKVADQEPPEARIRVSGDLGQTTIRPREKPPAPLIASASLGDGDVPIVAYRSSGFLVGTSAGEATHLASDGAIAPTPIKIDGPILAIAHGAPKAMTAFSDGHDVFLASANDEVVRLRQAASSSTHAIAFSPDAKWLAFDSGNGLSIWAVDGGPELINEFSTPSRPASIRWSYDGSWLACGLETGGFGLVRLADGRSGVVGGFPSPVRTVCWSTQENTLFASGAFRIAGWSMAVPPFEHAASGALETGRAAPVPVETMAAHPVRSLIAAGYANGRITVAQIGSRDELVVKFSGSAITALAWSGDGQHLAVGMVDGTAAIVTFPAMLFK
ncbi:WD40 repeat domain-containing protein [Mesorhizobium sp. B3-1-9]|uniref:WD40 repeat domain-containing protein n=1 Tax=Mesorhizobium sp. B3-1-9 TaxID=2589892 RepID=UPI00112ABCDD|nr:WD40 repeat domain-containing protein [Mesorhizobium sp. B3-1-9]TPI38129.1 WD40 repeat domain-containing protein [Mesorhizobium sp. B3-1-9]